MHRFAPLRRGLGAVLIVLASLPAHLFAAPTLIERAQIQATRATSSLMLVRGEGFQKAHLQRLEEDLRALDQAVRALAPDESLRLRHQALVDQLRQGVAFGPGEENMPWRYPEALSQALRDFLTALRAHPDATPAELAAKIEYLSVQYLSRAYFGNFEIAREQPNTYLGQDERVLVPAIDQEVDSLAAQNPELGDRLKIRWNYLRSAFIDMNSQSNALVSQSGRPFAPLAIDRHTRNLSEQWMALE
ncbi:MAG TPA: hypothetical protein VKY70_04245 [Pseudomonas sp.]|jgi:hypothetical protein|nr:hypothetical protein [Pseudomonas sp.]